MSTTATRVCYVTHEDDRHGVAALKCLRPLERAHTAILTGAAVLEKDALDTLFGEVLSNPSITSVALVAVQTSPGRYPSSHSRIAADKDFDSRGFVLAPWNRSEGAVHLMLREASPQIPPISLQAWHNTLSGVLLPKSLRRLRKSGGHKARIRRTLEDRIPQPYMS